MNENVNVVKSYEGMVRTETEARLNLKLKVCC